MGKEINNTKMNKEKSTSLEMREELMPPPLNRGENVIQWWGLSKNLIFYFARKHEEKIRMAGKNTREVRKSTI